jgi:hypothetical protein
MLSNHKVLVPFHGKVLYADPVQEVLSLVEDATTVVADHVYK